LVNFFFSFFIFLFFKDSSGGKDLNNR